MVRALIARLILGGAMIGAGGGLAGIGLANYTEAGTFHFYKAPVMRDRSAPKPTASEPSAVAFAADRLDLSRGVPDSGVGR
jgi:hypothetical protein